MKPYILLMADFSRDEIVDSGTVLYAAQHLVDDFLAGNVRALEEDELTDESMIAMDVLFSHTSRFGEPAEAYEYSARLSSAQKKSVIAAAGIFAKTFINSDALPITDEEKSMLIEMRNTSVH